MVVRSISGLKEVYQQVHQKVSAKDGTVVIYACYDLDSICATKILSVSQSDQKLFSLDGIRYKIIPVSGYTDLEERFNNLRDLESVVRNLLVERGGAAELRRAHQPNRKVVLRGWQ